MRQEVRGDASSGIGHADFGPVSGVAQRHLHRAALGRVFHSVRQQVHHHLLQPRRVARHRRYREVQYLADADLLGLRSRPHDLDRGVDEAARFDRADVQPQLTGIDPAQVQEVLDQLRLDPHALLDHVQAPLEFLRAPAPPQHVRPAQDGAQRTAQIVRDDGQELVVLRDQALRIGASRAFVRQQRLFPAPTLGHVLDDANHSGNGPAFVAQRATHESHPAGLAANTIDAVFAPVVAAAGQRQIDLDTRTCAVIGMEKRSQLAPGDRFARRQTQNGRRARPQGEEVARGVPAPVTQVGRRQGQLHSLRSPEQ